MTRPRPPRLVLVDAPSQTLRVLQDGVELFRCPVSTAENGLGCVENSGCTPWGWHRIAEVIGDGQPFGMRFANREPTGEIWTGQDVEGDWITTRILWLDGLEPGVNRGPGVDTHDRYVYIHGTAREDELGRPGSHGCVRVSNADATELADRILATGDLVWIGPRGPEGTSDQPFVPSLSKHGHAGIPSALRESQACPEQSPWDERTSLSGWHFSGIGGSGMSAIAFYLLGRGRKVSGSDRLFDQGKGTSIRRALESAGASIHPQDGSALDPGTTLIVSTAVEADVPEVRRAKELGCRVLHRSEALAELAAAQSTIAISGTSGKSTVTAMVFAILREAGMEPSVISGGVLRELSSAGHWGNAWGGSGEWLVIEADESDGSLVRYAPRIGVMLNLDRDHKELSELRDIFATFRDHSQVFLVNGDRPDCVEIGGPAAKTFGFHHSFLPLPEDLVFGPDFVSFSLGAVAFRVPFPGRHTAENALAALATASLAGADLESGARALASFQGVGRRHEKIGEARGVQVFDDFAHNPAKVEAALDAAGSVAGEGRVLAIFQPHGFGPLKFLLEDFAVSFAKALRPRDKLWISPVYDAGGTADRSVSSEDLGRRIRELGADVSCPTAREDVAARVVREAKDGDVVYSMGARDPELPAFAKSLLDSLAPTA